MDFYEVLNARRSIRKYLEKPIEPEKLERLWKAIQIAPTACNLQPFRFLCLRKGEQRKAVEEVLNFGRDGKGKQGMPFAAQAPYIIVALGHRNDAWKRFDGSSSHVIDVSIAMEHLVLAATQEGLGTCWICAFNQNALAEALGLSKEWEPVALTPLGYSDQQPREIVRKPVDTLIVEQ